MGLPRRAQLWGAMVELQWLFPRHPAALPEAQQSYQCPLVSNFSSSAGTVPALSIGPGAEFFCDLESGTPDRLPLHLVVSHTVKMAIKRRSLQARENKGKLESLAGLAWRCLGDTFASIGCKCKRAFQSQPSSSFLFSSISKINWISKNEIQQT